MDGITVANVEQYALRAPGKVLFLFYKKVKCEQPDVIPRIINKNKLKCESKIEFRLLPLGQDGVVWYAYILKKIKFLFEN